MTPVSLALISSFAFIVGLVVVIWNMANFMGGFVDGIRGDPSEPPNVVKKLIVHVLGGVMLGGGTIGLIASLAWYIVLRCK